MSALARGLPASRFAGDVRAGLAKPGQKELPSVYLYDEVGTALFEAITFVPEYGLTRADERILQRHAKEIAAHIAGPLVVAELGSGTGRKTRYVLEALSKDRRVVYFPIDVSATALARCRFEMANAQSIAVVGLEKNYIEGLAEVTARRLHGETIFVLFLGSTIGNFERAAANVFLSSVRRLLRPGDRLLLGTDLEKPVADLLVAYDDPAGVTAAFNLNILARINRELAGNFDLRRFGHEARYDEGNRRIEMHLVSKTDQTVSVPGASLCVDFAAGETIWTEACHKFRPEEVERMAGCCGFGQDAQWIDSEWPFAESLWTAV